MDLFGDWHAWLFVGVTFAVLYGLWRLIDFTAAQFAEWWNSEDPWA